MLKRLKSVSMLLFLMGASTRSSIRGRQSRRYRCENHTTDSGHVQELSVGCYR